MSPREKLISQAKAQGWRAPDWRHRDPLPIVSLEDFFSDNTDEYSIAANLEPHPGLETLYSTLRGIRERQDVQDVLIEITDLDEAEGSPEAWPYCGRVYILSSADEDTAAQWNQQAKADGPVEGWAASAPSAAPPLKEGFRIWQIIWD